MTATTQTLKSDFITLTASTINEVITAIFTAQTYNNIIKRIQHNSPFKNINFDDLKQDLFLYLLDDPGRTVEIYNKGQLRYWFTSICQRQLQSTKSKIFGRYLNKQQKQCELFEDTDAMNEDGKIDTSVFVQEYDLEGKIDSQDKFNYLLDLINNNINSSKQLKRNLTIYKMYYLDDLTIAQISKSTGIGQSLVFKYLKAAREWMTKNVDKSLFT